MRRVSLEYVMSAAKAFSNVTEEEGKTFRFALTSGIVTVRDQKKNIWLYPEARKVGVSHSFASIFSVQTPISDKGFREKRKLPSSSLPRKTRKASKPTSLDQQESEPETA